MESPGRAEPWDVSQLGNHDSPPMAPTHAWVAPKNRAARTTTGNDRKRPTRAAASAGTMSSVICSGVMVVWIEASSRPNAAASIVETIQLIAARRFGLYPRMSAPRSFSAAALVATPNRVNLKTAQAGRRHR